jgi:hypothetical protein
MPSLKTLNMLNVCLSSNSEAHSLKPDAEMNSIERQNFGGLFAKVSDEPGKAEHARWNLGLELGFSGEDDDRLDGASRQDIKEDLHR